MALKQINLTIDKFIDATLKNKKLLATEEELDKALSG